MAQPNPNVAALRTAYANWSGSKGDQQSIAGWKALLKPDIKFNSIAAPHEEVAFSQNFTASDQLAEYFQKLLADWEMIKFEAYEFIADGDRLVVRIDCAWKNKRTGKTCETPKIDYWRFDNGKAAEFSEFFDTAGAVAAATP